MTITDTTIEMTEIFTSVQGETSLTGLPTTFVRLSACNLRCTWCDTPYSFKRGKPYTIAATLKEVQKRGVQHVCVTGGEPLLQKGVHSLMQHLCDAGYHVNIETGGSLSTAEIDPRVKTILDIKCPGSGMEKHNLWENLDRLKEDDEVKFVVLNREDYDYAVAVSEKYGLFNRKHPVLFSPVFGKLESETLVDWILTDQYPIRFNLQTHKYIWEPNTRGV